MDSFPLTGFDGYTSKTYVFKATRTGDIKLEVVFPVVKSATPSTVLLHIHGGFLLVGDRYAFLPYWLVHVCTRRQWIFVTPEYRLLPETTAQTSLEDAIDASNWVVSSLSRELDRTIGSVLLAGSSAGAYLALATAATVQRKPAALLLIYGMLDPSNSRYTTPGTNIFGRPATETSSILAKFPKAAAEDHRQTLAAYPLPPDPATDPRMALISALHIDALFPDYLTGVDGLSRAIAAEGVQAIPERHRNLFPLDFVNLKNLPPTILVHGKNDSAVPAALSVRAAEKLRDAGVEVHTEFPEDAEHGFDSRAGNVDVEGPAGEAVTAFQSLRNAISFLDGVVQSTAQHA